MPVTRALNRRDKRESPFLKFTDTKLKTDGSYLFLVFMVRSGRPKRAGSGQFKWKGPGARVHFSRHTSPSSRALVDRSGSNP